MKSARIPLSIAAALLLLPLAGNAQKPEVGKWTGTVTPPGQGPVEVIYDVTMSGDTLAIAMTAAPHGTFKFEELKVADGKMTFSWSAGSERLKCALELKPDATWVGSCLEEGGGEPGTLVMVPPKKPS